jgi:hypothetical protein
MERTDPRWDPTSLRTLNLLFRRTTKVLVKLTLELMTLNVAHLLGALDGVHAVRVGASKDDIELLEATATGLREEEPDTGDDGGVEDGEHDVGLVAEVGEGGRGDHDDEEVGEPVGAGG